MGIAAYQRGNALISRQIDADRRAVEFELMDRFNALPKHTGAPAPWGNVHLIQGHGGWWAECPKTGFGYWYPTIDEAVRNWNIDVIGYDNGVWIATPRKATP